MVLPVPVGKTSRGRCTPRAVAASRAATASYWYGRGVSRKVGGGRATASIMRAPRVVGTRRADAVPEGLTDRCPKCASGDARLQRGVPGSDRLRRRPVQDTPGRWRRQPGVIRWPSRHARRAARWPGPAACVPSRQLAPHGAAPGVWSPAHARRSASACGRPPSMTMIATRSAQDSRWC